MNYLKSGALLIMLTTGLLACNKDVNTLPATSGSKEKSASDAVDIKKVVFVATQDSVPLNIDVLLFDTLEAKEFLSTGKNSYIGNADAIAKGKKIFAMYSCTQCHGPEAKGQVGPGLVGPDFKYPKDATNKGMFETIWHGTNGGMGAKGKGLMDPGDPANGLTPNEILKIIAWIRSHGSVTGNE
jgi:cytochrome c-L